MSLTCLIEISIERTHVLIFTFFASMAALIQFTKRGYLHYGLLVIGPLAVAFALAGDAAI